MDALYAINAKKESAVLNAPGSTSMPSTVTDSGISIAALLEYVNKYFPDVLPKNVLIHFRRNERPNSELSENVVCSVDDTEALTADKAKLAVQIDAAAGNTARLTEQTALENRINKMSLPKYRAESTKLRSGTMGRRCIRWTR